MKRVRIHIERRSNPCTAKEVPHYWNGQPMGTKLVPCPTSYLTVYGYNDIKFFEIEKDCDGAKINGKEVEKKKVEEIEEFIDEILSDNDTEAASYHETSGACYHYINAEFLIPRYYYQKLRRLAKKFN